MSALIEWTTLTVCARLQEDLGIPGVQVPDGLAYDWIYKHLYWTDTSSNTINVACVDDEKEERHSLVLYHNSNPKCTELTSEEVGTDICIDEPRALAVHPRKVRPEGLRHRPLSDAALILLVMNTIIGTR